MHKALQRAARIRRQKAGSPPHAVAHHQRGIGLKFASFIASGRGAWIAFLAVLGPGLLAGLSDDDPAGITTYSVLGAGMTALPGSDIPNASAREFIVVAVPMVLHNPVEGADVATSSTNPS